MADRGLVAMNTVPCIIYRQSGIDEYSYKKHALRGKIEFLQILEGSGTFFIRDKVFEIRPNSVLILRMDQTHCSNPAVPDRYVRNKLIVDSRYLQGLYEAIGERELGERLFGRESNCFQVSDAESQFIDALFRKLQQVLQTDERHKGSYLADTVLRIVLCSVSQREVIRPSEHHIINPVLRYINENYAARLSLDELAEAFSVNKSYLCRVFKKTTGITLMRYVQDRRLEAVKRLLVGTDTPISQIAMDTGFSSFTSLSRAFREHMGVSPSQYRRLHRGPG